jgi:VIT1/CCC1 family predicted Fe2+/Mn2+ transporter
MGPHRERHRAGDAAWLRAAVLGANDGIVSIASLVLGVAAAESSPSGVLTAGVAGLVGGALSMAAGEYVSVSSQRDVELADLEREKKELKDSPASERAELVGIYVDKGLSPALAEQVADALVLKTDALHVHAKEELRIDMDDLSRPGQAAVVSALSFATGAALPLLAITLSPGDLRAPITLGAALGMLGILGGWSARLGGAPVTPAIARVVFGGVLAMGLTYALGLAFGAGTG